jgi:hypothetical protein
MDDGLKFSGCDFGIETICLHKAYVRLKTALSPIILRAFPRNSDSENIILDSELIALDYP